MSACCARSYASLITLLADQRGTPGKIFKVAMAECEEFKLTRDSKCSHCETKAHFNGTCICDLQPAQYDSSMDEAMSSDSPFIQRILRTRNGLEDYDPAGSAQVSAPLLKAIVKDLEKSASNS